LKTSAISWAVIAAVASWSTGLRETPARADPNSVQIDTREIVRHVVPRDAIPALIMPKYDSIADAGYMRPDDRIIALDFEGRQLAYPTRILDHHEIVDDLVNGQPILVTY
jgi:uncharacterized protein DUF3179